MIGRVVNALGQPIDGKGPFSGGTSFCVEKEQYINPMARPPIRERLELADLPQWMKGTPGALIAAGLMAVAFSGFAGMI